MNVEVKFFVKIKKNWGGGGGGVGSGGGGSGGESGGVWGM